jgi:hypothetical protein
MGGGEDGVDDMVGEESDSSDLSKNGRLSLPPME